MYIKIISRFLRKKDLDIRKPLELMKLRSYYPEVWFTLNPIEPATWYIPYATNCSTTTSCSTSYARYIPFIPPRKVRLTGIGFEVTTAVSATAQLGVYNTLNFRPYSRLAIVTGLDCSTTGFKSGSISLVLDPLKLYWLAIATTASVSVRCVPRSGMLNILGIRPTVADYMTQYLQSVTTLPATASPTIVYTVDVPAIFIRFEHV